jgi:hypothetical protein
MYKGDFSLLGICQCQVEWPMNFAGTVKIRGFHNFYRYKSREGGQPVRYGSTLKFLVEDDYTGLKYVTLRDTASVIMNQWGDKIKNVKFWAHYEIAKFTWVQ